MCALTNTKLQLKIRIKRPGNYNSGYVLHELPEDDPQRRCPDIQLAKNELGWIPRVTLLEGLSPTIDWFERCLNE